MTALQKAIWLYFYQPETRRHRSGRHLMSASLITSYRPTKPLLLSSNLVNGLWPESFRSLKRWSIPRCVFTAISVRAPDILIGVSSKSLGARNQSIPTPSRHAILLVGGRAMECRENFPKIGTINDWGRQSSPAQDAESDEINYSAFTGRTTSQFSTIQKAESCRDY